MERTKHVKMKVRFFFYIDKAVVIENNLYNTNLEKLKLNPNKERDGNHLQ